MVGEDLRAQFAPSRGEVGTAAGLLDQGQRLGLGGDRTDVRVGLVGIGAGLVVLEGEQQQFGAGLLARGSGQGNRSLQQFPAAGDVPDQIHVGQVAGMVEAQVLALLGEPARSEDAPGPEVLPFRVVGGQMGGGRRPHAALVPFREQGVHVRLGIPLELERDVELRSLSPVRVGLRVEGAHSVRVPEPVVVRHMVEPHAREAEGGAVDVVVPAEHGALLVPCARGLLAHLACLGIDPLHAVVGHEGDQAGMHVHALRRRGHLAVGQAAEHLVRMLLEHSLDDVVGPVEVEIRIVHPAEEVLLAGDPCEAVRAGAVAAAVVGAERVGGLLRLLREGAADVAHRLLDESRRGEAGLPAMGAVGGGQKALLLPCLDREELGMDLGVGLGGEEVDQIVVEADPAVHPVSPGPGRVRATPQAAEQPREKGRFLADGLRLDGDGLGSRHVHAVVSRQQPAHPHVSLQELADAELRPPVRRPADGQRAFVGEGDCEAVAVQPGQIRLRQARYGPDADRVAGRRQGAFQRQGRSRRLADALDEEPGCRLEGLGRIRREHHDRARRALLHHHEVRRQADAGQDCQESRAENLFHRSFLVRVGQRTIHFTMDAAGEKSRRRRISQEGGEWTTPLVPLGHEPGTPYSRVAGSPPGRRRTRRAGADGPQGPTRHGPRQVPGGVGGGGP